MFLLCSPGIMRSGRKHLWLVSVGMDWRSVNSLLSDVCNYIGRDARVSVIDYEMGIF